jgi:glutamate decarboxylase
MVRLAKVKRGPETQPSQPTAVRDRDEDVASSSVYGTHFSLEHLPHGEMSEREMPPGIAYRMIKDELSLDGNPLLK